MIRGLVLLFCGWILVTVLVMVKGLVFERVMIEY